MGNDSKTEAVEFPAGRNVGCCGLARATDGRHHNALCVNRCGCYEPLTARRDVEWVVKS